MNIIIEGTRLWQQKENKFHLPLLVWEHKKQVSQYYSLHNQHYIDLLSLILEAWTFWDYQQPHKFQHPVGYSHSFESTFL